MKTLLLLCVLWMSGWSRVCAQDPVTVPFQFTGNHIFVPILINGKGPYSAAFDTGSSLFVITPAVAKSLHLTTKGAARVDGLGGKTVGAALAEVESVQIGSVRIPRPTFAVVDMGKVPFSTTVGCEVLHQFVVRVDYGTRLLTLTRPDKFVYRGSGVILPLHLFGNTPTVEGVVDGVKGLFTLDTGSGGALELFSPFVQTYDLRHKYAAGFTRETGVGLGGAMRAQSVHIGSLALGAAEVRRVETYLSTDQGGASSAAGIAGNIGETVLKQFNLTFDYAHGQVILEKNKGYGRPEDGHAGLGLEPQGRTWRVISVTPDGAAAQAGIREGDRVLQIEGKDADQASLLTLWDIFHRPVGTKVWIALQDGSQKRLVAVTLGKVP